MAVCALTYVLENEKYIGDSGAIVRAVAGSARHQLLRILDGFAVDPSSFMPVQQ